MSATFPSIASDHALPIGYPPAKKQQYAGLCRYDKAVMMGHTSPKKETFLQRFGKQRRSFARTFLFNMWPLEVEELARARIPMERVTPNYGVDVASKKQLLHGLHCHFNTLGSVLGSFLRNLCTLSWNLFRPAKASKGGTVWAVVIQSLSSFLLVGQKATRKTGVCLHILARPLTVQPYFATSQPEKGCLVPPTPAGRKWACFLKRSPKLVCFLFKANQPWASFKTKTGLPPEKNTKNIRLRPRAEPGGACGGEPAARQERKRVCLFMRSVRTGPLKRYILPI